MIGTIYATSVERPPRRVECRRSARGWRPLVTKRPARHAARTALRNRDRPARTV